MQSIKDRVAIVGMGCCKFGERWDTGTNDLLVESFERFLRHLQANEVDLNKTLTAVGPMLTIDTEKEKFVGQFSDRANMFLSRNYREPFVVPENV